VDLELDEARPPNQRRFDPTSRATAIALGRKSLEALESCRELLQQLIRHIDEVIITSR